MIPKTTTFKQFKERKAREAANGTGIEAGQQTLDGRQPNRPIGSTDDAEIVPVTNGVASNHQEPSQMPLLSPTSPTGPSILSPVNGSSMVDRTVHPTMHGYASNEDIQMTG